MQAKMRDNRPQWRKPKEIEKRYRALCEKMHLSSKFYDLSFERNVGGWQMDLRKKPEVWREYLRRMGKNILVTDRSDWTDEEIVQAALDRYIIENSFRQTKDDDLVSALPIRPLDRWKDQVSLPDLRGRVDLLGPDSKTPGTVRGEFICSGRRKPDAAITFMSLLDQRPKEAGSDHRTTH